MRLLLFPLCVVDSDRLNDVFGVSWDEITSDEWVRRNGGLLNVELRATLFDNHYDSMVLFTVV